MEFKKISKLIYKNIIFHTNKNIHSWNFTKLILDTGFLIRLLNTKLSPLSVIKINYLWLSKLILNP